MLHEQRGEFSTEMTATTAAIGIMAYNEEANIGRLLDSILSQTASERITRIVVVASGCTDQTCSIVTSYAHRDARIYLVVEPDRGGKIQAINSFLSSALEPILLVSAADIIYEPDTVDKLLAPFANDDVGMVGAHAVPLNASDTFVGFAVNWMWKLHHEISTHQPKMGELVAIRNVFRKLDAKMLADEVQLDYGLRAVGYEVVYAPEARIRNRGPETLREFIAQRVRWISYNLQMQREHNLPVSTLSLATVAQASIVLLRREHPRADWLAGIAGLELYCRILARMNYYRLRSPGQRLWEPQSTTKSLVPIADAAPATTFQDDRPSGGSANSGKPFVHGAR